MIPVKHRSSHITMQSCFCCALDCWITIVNQPAAKGRGHLGLSQYRLPPVSSPLLHLKPQFVRSAFWAVTLWYRYCQYVELD